MTARTTFSSSVASAGQTMQATIAAAAVTLQEGVNAQTIKSGTVASGGNVTGPGFGQSASQIASIKTAQQTYNTTVANAQATCNASVDSAKQTLRNTGDVDPF